MTGLMWVLKSESDQKTLRAFLKGFVGEFVLKADQTLPKL